MKLATLFTCIIATLIVASCAPLDVAAPPVSKLVLSKKADTKSLEQGREIYATACTKCHGPARIDHGTDEHWAGRTLPKMCRWSKLTPEQTGQVYAYVMTARHSMPPAAAH